MQPAEEKTTTAIYSLGINTTCKFSNLHHNAAFFKLLDRKLNKQKNIMTNKSKIPPTLSPYTRVYGRRWVNDDNSKTRNAKALQKSKSAISTHKFTYATPCRELNKQTTQSHHTPKNIINRPSIYIKKTLTIHLKSKIVLTKTQNHETSDKRLNPNKSPHTNSEHPPYTVKYGKY